MKMPNGANLHCQTQINQGWEVLVLWECEIKDKDKLQECIELFLTIK